MRQIMSWTVGSFFRTIGRIAAFIVIGGLIAFLVSRCDFDWGIKDLFFTKVKASEQITKWSVIYTDANRTTQGISVTLTSNLDMNYTTTKFYWPNNNTNVYQYQGGYVIIPFTLQTPIMSINYENNIYGDDYCNRWNCALWDSSTNTCSRFTCAAVSGSQDSTLQDREYITPTIAVKAKLYTKHNDISYNVACFVEDGSFKCPINYGVDYMDYIQIESNVNYGSSTVTKQYKLEITNFIIVEYDKSQAIIDSVTNQTQQQQQQHEELMDTNMTETNETASNFFNSFEDDDVGGLSGIITAPLVMINEMLNGVCVQPSATWKGATISLPCGDLLWSRNGAADLKNLLNVFYGGVVCYYAIRKLFLMIESMKDPTSDKIEVTDL